LSTTTSTTTTPISTTNTRNISYYALYSGDITKQGCNYWQSTYTSYSHGIGACVYETSETSYFDGAKRSSKKICTKQGLFEYEYNNTDCSGNPVDISQDGSNDYECVSTQESCDYFTLVRYDELSNCSKDGKEVNSKITHIVGKCITEISSFHSYNSVYYDCDEHGAVAKEYNSSDCTGDYVEDVITAGEYHNDWLWDGYDYDIYCSVTDTWTGCNANGIDTNNGNNDNDDNDENDQFSLFYLCCYGLYLVLFFIRVVLLFLLLFWILLIISNKKLKN